MKDTLQECICDLLEQTRNPDKTSMKQSSMPQHKHQVRQQVALPLNAVVVKVNGRSLTQRVGLSGVCRLPHRYKHASNVSSILCFRCAGETKAVRSDLHHRQCPDESKRIATQSSDGTRFNADSHSTFRSLVLPNGARTKYLCETCTNS